MSDDWKLGQRMEITYEGKTNRLIRLGDRTLLQFKDALVGDAKGNVDPGGDFVVGQLEGKGAASAKVAAYFFKLMNEAGIDTHFLGVHSDTELEIRPITTIQLEVIYRALAYGSFLQRYRGYVQPMAELDLVEFNLKDDALGDPLLERRVVTKLGIASPDEVGRMEVIARRVVRAVTGVLTDQGLKLVDMKLEFGRIGENLVVIDALSGDTMRVYDPAKGKVLNQLELAEGLGLT